MNTPYIDVSYQGHKLLSEAITFYRSRQDKGYSLTDCISMLVMREMGINSVLTSDKHFLQEGFVTLL